MEHMKYLYLTYPYKISSMVFVKMIRRMNKCKYYYIIYSNKKKTSLTISLENLN